MDERQARPDGAGREPNAARTPVDSAAPPDDLEAYEPPPAPPAGAVWGPNRPTGDDSDRDEPGSSDHSGGDSAGGAAPSSGRPTVPGPFAGSARPVSVAPSANAARASVPGALRPDAASVRASTWPNGQSKIYGVRTDSAAEAGAEQP